MSWAEENGMDIEPPEYIQNRQRRTKLAYEVKNNSGSLFSNDKQGNEARPDWTGSMNIDGKMFWISAWEKDGAKGKFFSLSFKPKEADFKKLKDEIQEQGVSKIDDIVDDIPF